MHCPACAASTSQDVPYTVQGFPIARCRECGLGRTVLPADHDPLALYDDAYFHGGQADGYADYAGSAAILKQEFRALLGHLREAGVTGGRLVEIGCAFGFFLDEAAAAFDVCGVEVAREAVASCRARGHDVHCGAVTDEFLAARGPFDVLVMLDVIEHLERPGDVLATLARHAAPNATLLLTTGDWGAVTSRVLGRRWRLMTPPQHLWFFTQPSLSRLLAQAGFQVTAVQHPWKRVPLELMAFQLGRGLHLQRLVRRLPLPDVGLPINLFDAMRVTARFRGSAR